MLLDEVLLFLVVNGAWEGLNILDLVEYLLLGVSAEALDVFGVVYDGGVDCCLVLEIDIFGEVVVGVCALGPGGVEGVAVESAVFLVDAFRDGREGGGVVTLVTLIMIILNYFVQITLQFEQFQSRALAPPSLLGLFAPTLSLLLLGTILWGFQHEIIHDVLHLHPDKSTRDRSQYHV